MGIFVSGPGQTYIVSLFVDPILKETGWSRTLVSGLYSAASIGAVFGAILSGIAFDRFGARIALTGVVILFGFSVFMMGQISNPIHLLIGFFAIRNLGQTALTLISTSMVGVWFIRLRGRATSITMVASPASQAILPPIIHWIIANNGWRNAWELLGVAVLAVMIIPAILLVRRSPESVGLLPDGDLKTDPTLRHPPVREIFWTANEAIQTRTFWLLIVASAPHSMIGTALTFHHMSLMKSSGIEETLAAWILSFMAVSALVSTMITGYLLDRFPGRFVLVAGQICIMIAMIWILFVTSPLQGLIYGGLLGVAQGLSHMANLTIWPNYFGRRHIGSIRGIAVMGTVIASGLGPLPFSILFEATRSYDVTILTFLFLPAICGIAALTAVPPIKNPTQSESHPQENRRS